MRNDNHLAPIALFVFNRPYHTRQTVESLLQNPEAKHSKLFIYSDGPRDINDHKAVNEVRTYIHSLDGFEDIQIVERDRNIGLAESIIQGVTELTEKFGRVIVMEDDLVTSPAFLDFMNRALDTYQAERKVWHISGWSYPIDNDGLGSAFLWETMNCWGWATWKDRWQYFSKEPDKLVSSWNRAQIKQFNLDGAYNFWKQVKLNKRGKLNTWAVFWYATIFENNGLCLNPAKTFVTNIGHDGSGENCRRTTHFSTHDELELNNNHLSFPLTIESSELAKIRIKAFLERQNGKNIFVRSLKRLKRINDWLKHQ